MIIAELPCAIGCLVFTIATIRAGVCPRWAAVLMLIGAAVFSEPLVCGIALAWLGWSLALSRLGASSPSS